MGVNVSIHPFRVNKTLHKRFAVLPGVSSYGFFERMTANVITVAGREFLIFFCPKKHGSFTDPLPCHARLPSGVERCVHTDDARTQ